MAVPTNGPNTPQKVTDGISHTMMFFEDGGRPNVYDATRTLQPGTATGCWADRDNEFDVNSAICGNGDQVDQLHQR